MSGEASPLLAAHLQKLGAAYEKQGKMEAATLTLEEAGSVLEAAYGPDHPELGVLRHRISAMHGAARDGNGMPVSFAAAPEMPRKQLNSARGGSAGAFGAALPAPTPRGQSSSAEGASATGVAASAAPAPAGLVPSLTLPSGTPAPAPALVLPPDVVLKNFSSQRMRARLEARQRRLAEEGAGSLGLSMQLPPPPAEFGVPPALGMSMPPPSSVIDPSFAVSPLLEKKRALFRERMAKRRLSAETSGGITRAPLPGEKSHAADGGGGGDDDDDDDDNHDDDEHDDEHNED